MAKTGLSGQLACRTVGEVGGWWVRPVLSGPPTSGGRHHVLCWAGNMGPLAGLEPRPGEVDTLHSFSLHQQGSNSGRACTAPRGGRTARPLLHVDGWRSVKMHESWPLAGLVPHPGEVQYLAPQCKTSLQDWGDGLDVMCCA